MEDASYEDIFFFMPNITVIKCTNLFLTFKQMLCNNNENGKILQFILKTLIRNDMLQWKDFIYTIT